MPRSLPVLTPTETDRGWVLRAPDGRDYGARSAFGEVWWSDRVAAEIHLSREGAERAAQRLASGRRSGLE